MPNEKEAAKEFIPRTVKDRDAKLISLWFIDIINFRKSYDITPRELETALSDGIVFNGSSIKGFAVIDESD